MSPNQLLQKEKTRPPPAAGSRLNNVHPTRRLHNPRGASAKIPRLSPKTRSFLRKFASFARFCAGGNQPEVEIRKKRGFARHLFGAKKDIAMPGIDSAGSGPTPKRPA